MKINVQIGTRSPPPFFKRVVVWLLLLAFIPVFFPAFALNARADETPAFLELLDYGYVQHPDHYVSGNRTEIIDGDEVVHFNLPYGMTINYVDMLIYASTSVNNYVSAGLSAWGYSSLTVSKISPNLWRVYGNIPEHTYEKLEIVFMSSSTSGYVNFYSCRVGFGGNEWKYVPFQVQTPNQYLNWSGSYSTEVIYNSAYEVSGTASILLTSGEWAAYDEITVFLSFSVSSIVAINATVGNDVVPVEVTYLENDPPGEDEVPYYNFMVTIDLTEVRRNPYSQLKLDIECNLNNNGYASIFYFVQSIGYARLRYADPELYWYQEIFKGLVGEDGIPFMQYINSGVEAMAGVVGNMYVYMTQEIGFLLDEIATRLFDLEYECSRGFTRVVSAVQTFYNDTKKQLDDIIDALSPDTTNSNEMIDDMASQATEMGELNNQMDSMQKPDVGSIDTDLSGLVSSGDVTLATTALTVVLSDGFMSSIFMMALLFMLASYVLFGKR